MEQVFNHALKGTMVDHFMYVQDSFFSFFFQKLKLIKLTQNPRIWETLPSRVTNT